MCVVCVYLTFAASNKFRLSRPIQLIYRFVPSQVKTPRTEGSPLAACATTPVHVSLLFDRFTVGILAR
jgi:hypothetical protein